MKKTVREIKTIKELKDKADDFANSYNSAKAQKTAKSQLQEFIRNAEWASIDPLEARRMIEDPLKARGVDARYIRMILPKKYKYEYQDRTKKGQIEHDDPANELQKIKDLQDQVRYLRHENEILNQPFVARGLISLYGNNMPIKILINPKTKLIEKGELDYEAMKQAAREEYKREKQIKQEISYMRSRH